MICLFPPCLMCHAKCNSPVICHKTFLICSRGPPSRPETMHCRTSLLATWQTTHEQERVCFPRSYTCLHTSTAVRKVELLCYWKYPMCRCDRGCLIQPPRKESCLQVLHGEHVFLPASIAIVQSWKRKSLKVSSFLRRLQLYG